jgi:hypothetical protein
MPQKMPELVSPPYVVYTLRDSQSEINKQPVLYCMHDFDLGGGDKNAFSQLAKRWKLQDLKIVTWRYQEFEFPLPAFVNLRKLDLHGLSSTHTSRNDRTAEILLASPNLEHLGLSISDEWHE